MANNRSNYEIKCSYCLQNYTIQNIVNHYEECDKLPIPCENNCKNPMVPRGKMKEHLLKCCSVACHSCRFKDIGCNTVGVKGTLDEHEAESINSHMFLLLKSVNEQKNEINECYNKINNYELENSELRAEVTSLKNQISSTVYVKGNKNEGRKGRKRKRKTEIVNSTRVKNSTTNTDKNIVAIIAKPKIIPHSPKNFNWYIKNAAEKLNLHDWELSPEFYSPFGYKLQLKMFFKTIKGEDEDDDKNTVAVNDDDQTTVNTNEDNTDKSKISTNDDNTDEKKENFFISIDVHWLPGPHDQQLIWPFAEHMTIAIINPKKNKKFYRRLKGKNDKPSKMDGFCLAQINNIMSHDDIYNKEFTHGDTLNVQVIFR